jgi:hypothetical protein
MDVYIENQERGSAKLRQLAPQRDWMNSGNYNCYPIVVANTLGYGLYYDEDISFIWDGNHDNPAKGILGKKYIWEGRSNGTVSFSTGLVFKSNKDVSLMTMEVPNQFREEYHVMGSILSTSFFTGELSVVLKINPSYINKEILIPAKTDIACVLPISISQFDNSNMNMTTKSFPYPKVHDRQEYIDALHEHFHKTGNRLRLYKKGIDEVGNKVGEHESGNIKMNVNYID